MKPKRTKKNSNKGRQSLGTTAPFTPCIVCNIAFSTTIDTDGSKHTEICKPDSKFDPEKLSLLDDLEYGFLINDTLIATTVIDKDMKKAKEPNRIYMHCYTMDKLSISLGNNVIVNHKHVFKAWCSNSLPLCSVALSHDAAAQIGAEEKKPIVLYQWDQLVRRATHVSLLNNGDDRDFMKKPELSSYLAEIYKDRIVTSGVNFNIKYYGSKCSFTVLKIRDVEESIAEADDVLTQGLQRLDIAPEDKTVSLKRTSRHFARILPTTRITIDSAATLHTKSLSGVALSQLGGLDSQIQTIKELIRLSKSESQASLFGDMPRGALIYGPSGCGKSLLIKAVAEDSGMEVITIETSKIWNKYHGESQEKLSSFFEMAKQKRPSIIVIDEIQTLCPRPDRSNNEVEKRVAQTLITLIGDLMNDREKGVFVLAATISPDQLDPALRRSGRLDREVEIMVPNNVQRAQILEKLLPRQRSCVTAGEIADVAASAHGFTGGDLTALCSEAIMSALRRGGSGKNKITSADLLHGLNSVQPSAMKEVTIEVPKVSWSDIGGQGDLKQKLKQAIEWPLKNPEAFQRMGIKPPRGLLMYGPPGCSKTMIAKALAHDSGLNFLSVKGPELLSQWVGESERAMREVFKKARGAAPSIIFFDEIDALAKERGSGSGGGSEVGDRVLTQLLTELDGVHELNGVIVVAATNRPDHIDAALLRPGRFDRIVYVPLPDAQTREQILSIHFKKMPVAEDVCTQLDTLVERTDKYSGAEVMQMCAEASLHAMEENIDATEVNWSHFEHALQKVRPRVPEALIRFYDDFARTSGLHPV